MNQLIAKRKELGLNQQQVAFLLGTKQSNISSYERGVLEPGSVIEQRFEALLGLSLVSQSVYRNAGFPTLASQVAQLRELIAMPRCATSDDQDSLIVRALIDTHDRFQELRTEADQRFFLMQPGSCGLHRGDVAFAGMAVHWSRQADLSRVPNWTRDPGLFLDRPWFVDGGGENSALGVMSLARGVPALRARGVFLAATNLDSV